MKINCVKCSGPIEVSVGQPLALCSKWESINLIDLVPISKDGSKSIDNEKNIENLFFF